MNQAEATAKPPSELRAFATALGYGLTAGLLVAALVVFYRTAWLCDDAYITFRTVDNWVNGFGLRWNVNERVQPYTHPLWMGLHSLVHYFGRGEFAQFVWVAIATSMTAVALLGLAVARSRSLAVVGIVTLLSSRAYVDYATSGLENPLTHVLLAVFLLLFAWQEWRWIHFFAMGLVAALAAVNRMDTLLLYAPALLYAALGSRSPKAWSGLALGFVPFLAWEVFSLAYYGFLFPNTAYAKLGTGIDRVDLMQQGLHYFEHTLNRDPLTLAVIAAGLVAPLFLGSWRACMISLGIALYLLYIIRIGGDFMGGRFFTAPLFLAVCLIVRIRIAPPMWLAAIPLIIWGATQSAEPLPFLTGAEHGQSVQGFKDNHGIGDERRFYFQRSSLVNAGDDKEMPIHDYAQTGRQYRASGVTMTKTHGSVGFRGFFGGPLVHIIDYYALADPLLARLPRRYTPDWRIGHFARHIPPGYPETTGSANTNKRLQGDALQEYYDALSLIIRGPLWSGERWRAIWTMNTGGFDDLVDRDAYAFPRLRPATPEQLSDRMAEGTPAVGPNSVPLPSGGLEIAWDTRQHAATVELSAENTSPYHVIFMDGDRRAWTTNVGPKSLARNGLAVYTITLPESVAENGYTATRVMGIGRRKAFRIGHLIPLQ